MNSHTHLRHNFIQYQKRSIDGELDLEYMRLLFSKEWGRVKKQGGDENLDKSEAGGGDVEQQCQ